MQRYPFIQSIDFQHTFVQPIDLSYRFALPIERWIHRRVDLSYRFAQSIDLSVRRSADASIYRIDPFHGQIYGRARKRFNARNHAPWWDCSDLEAACKSECFRELDRIAKTRYLEKLKLLGLDKTDDSFQLFVTRSNRSGKLISWS